MPHKRNPKVAERISGLARVVRGAAVVGLENVPLWHERDISHSSAERIVIPDAFLALDYMLDRFTLDRRRASSSTRSGCCGTSTRRTASFFSHRLLLALVESRPRARRGVPARAAERDARLGRGARLPRARRAPTPRSRAHLDAAALADVFDLDATVAARRQPSSSVCAALAPKEEPVLSEATPRRQRQGPRALRARRRAAAARRERPHLDVRRRPADRDPRQGPRAHRALGVLVRADAATSSRTTCSRCATTAARPSAAGSRCCRSSASSAATSPAPAGRTTSRPARSAGTRCPTGLVESEQLPRADLHAGDEGADRPRREHRPRRSRRARRRGALRRGRAADARALPVRLGARARARDHPRRHEARVRRRRRRARSCSATRRSRPTRRASGRPTSTRPAAPQPSFDKQFVRDYCESLGWDKTYPGPELPDDVVDGHARALRRGVRAADRHRVRRVPRRPDGRARMKATVLVRPKPGILDPQGQAVESSLRHLGFDGRRRARRPARRRSSSRPTTATRRARRSSGCASSCSRTR